MKINKQWFTLIDSIISIFIISAIIIPSFFIYQSSKKEWGIKYELVKNVNYSLSNFSTLVYNDIKESYWVDFDNSLFEWNYEDLKLCLFGNKELTSTFCIQNIRDDITWKSYIVKVDSDLNIIPLTSPKDIYIEELDFDTSENPKISGRYLEKPFVNIKLKLRGKFNYDRPPTEDELQDLFITRDEYQTGSITLDNFSIYYNNLK